MSAWRPVMQLSPTVKSTEPEGADWPWVKISMGFPQKAASPKIQRRKLRFSFDLDINPDPELVRPDSYGVE